MKTFCVGQNRQLSTIGENINSKFIFKAHINKILQKLRDSVHPVSFIKTLRVPLESLGQAQSAGTLQMSVGAPVEAQWGKTGKPVFRL